ncbi:MAG: 2-oxo-4-hydroxy-4-carboxy-5-ureidoimidazoline decarboxylase [Bacteroidota bacterium]
MTLPELNQLAEAEAVTLLTQCCGSSRWVGLMVDRRPYESNEHLLDSAQEVWAQCTDKDFLEAFDHHPKIGDLNTLKAKYANTSSLAASEQGDMAEVSLDTLKALQQQNVAYEERFGFIFIVFATGRTAAEMLAILESRLPNSREIEIKIAAEEQLKITLLRLKKLIA